jgi:hypothetical protein
LGEDVDTISGVNQRLKRLLRPSAWPARAFFDPRFARLQDHVLAGISDLEHRVIKPEMQTALEFITLQGRAIDQLTQRVEELAHLPADKAAEIFIDAPLDVVGEGCAGLLDYAASHRGFDAQASLWFNPPLSLSHHPGTVTVGTVNERVVEVPYTVSKVCALPVGSAVLDFGAMESTLSFSLASLGYQVTALDLMPYPLDHPNVTVVAEQVEGWVGPERPFDAIVSLSTLEHVGLGGYGGQRARPDHDSTVLERMRGWLRTGGLLVLTAPFGKNTIDDLQRTYDDAALDALLKRWTVVDRRYGICTDNLHWMVSDAPPSADAWENDEARGVILVTAENVS